MRKILSTGGVTIQRRRSLGVRAIWLSAALASATTMLLLIFVPKAISKNNQSNYLRFGSGNIYSSTIDLPQIGHFSTSGGTYTAASPLTAEHNSSRPGSNSDNQDNSSATADSARHIVPMQRETTSAVDTEVNSSSSSALILCETGTAAYATGDYQTAYDAYEASYAVVPTPHALIGSAKALEQLSKQLLKDTTSEDKDDNATGS